MGFLDKVKGLWQEESKQYVRGWVEVPRPAVDRVP